MEEILDRFILRILFVGFTCLLLFFYRYAHYIFYPPGKRQLKKIFDPVTNPSNTLHYLSRILGITLIFSGLEFNYFYSLPVGIMNMLIIASVTVALYLSSIYLTESIILYKFDYSDEVLKRENFSYSVINLALNISLALLIKQIVSEAENSLVILFLLWLYSMVIFGFTTKLFPLYSMFNFNQQLIQKNMGLALSYSGFILGNTIILTLAFDQDHYDITSYSIRIILKILLSSILVPIFIIVLHRIFSIKEKKVLKREGHKINPQDSVGMGLTEGILYLSAAILTSMIVYKINLSTIIPFN